VHNVGGYTNCYNGTWNEEFCPDTETCKKNCAVEGVQKVTGGVELKYMTAGGNVGSRLYVTDGEESYKMFKLLNREFTLDVDVSTLVCGLNGAVYFVEMAAMGGKGLEENNRAGAKYGTGYCDAQCPHEKFERNESHGICCVEMDIWEANKRATAFTPHPCSTVGPTRCTGIDCGYGAEDDARWKGLCDKDGCDMNAYRMGNKNFYGNGSDFRVDTTKPMTVVTQFHTSDGTDEGHLVEIRRLYVQNGKVIAHADSTLPGIQGGAVTDKFCNAQKAVFGDIDHHQAKGRLEEHGGDPEARHGLELVGLGRLLHPDAMAGLHFSCRSFRQRPSRCGTGSLPRLDQPSGLRQESLQQGLCKVYKHQVRRYRHHLRTDEGPTIDINRARVRFAGQAE
ncbi:unnamed protein product, partial [Polarella glacialis]